MALLAAAALFGTVSKLSGRGKREYSDSPAWFDHLEARGCMGYR